MASPPPKAGGNRPWGRAAGSEGRGRQWNPPGLIVPAGCGGYCTPTEGSLSDGPVEGWDGIHTPVRRRWSAERSLEWESRRERPAGEGKKKRPGRGGGAKDREGEGAFPDLPVNNLGNHALSRALTTGTRLGAERVRPAFSNPETVTPDS